MTVIRLRAEQNECVSSFQNREAVKMKQQQVTMRWHSLLEFNTKCNRIFVIFLEEYFHSTLHHTAKEASCVMGLLYFHHCTQVEWNCSTSPVGVCLSVSLKCSKWPAMLCLYVCTLDAMAWRYLPVSHLGMNTCRRQQGKEIVCETPWSKCSGYMPYVC